MAKNSTFYAVSGFNQFGANISPTETTVAQTLHTASAEGCIIKALNISSNDAAILYMELSIVDDSANIFVLGTFPIPITAGQSATGAVPSVNALDSTNIVGIEQDIQGNNIIKLAPLWLLKARMIATVTAGDQVDILGSYESITV